MTKGKKPEKVSRIRPPRVRNTRMDPMEEPDPLTELPDPPDWLNIAARDQWETLGTELVNRRILTTLDLAGLEVFSALAGKVRQMTQAGVDVPASHLAELRRWHEAFCITPGTRHKQPKPKPDPKENPFHRRGPRPESE